MIRLSLAMALCAAAASRAEEIDYKKLYTTVSPAVVLVYGEEAGAGSVGTGSIIDGSGLVVTNAHVILQHESRRPFEKLFVFLKPDRITGQNDQDLKRGFEAHWLAYEPSLDLALLQLKNPPDALPTLPLAKDEAGVGEATAAIGHPEQGARWSLTTGRIGGEWTNFEGVKGKDVYQMETSVNRGNSGGPLLDGNGYMVGINTAIARRSEDGLAITGVNFAIKSAVVRRWLQIVAAQVRLDPSPSVSPPPPPAAVAAAEPAPLAAEREPEARQEPQQLAKRAPVRGGAVPAKTTAPVEVPAAPPPGERGFTSSEPPGRTLSPQEAVHWRAQKAFDDLEAEAQRRKK